MGNYHAWKYEGIGVTRAAMEIRRSRLMKNQPKKETANA